MFLYVALEGDPQDAPPAYPPPGWHTSALSRASASPAACSAMRVAPARCMTELGVQWKEQGDNPSQLGRRIEW